MAKGEKLKMPSHTSGYMGAQTIKQTNKQTNSEYPKVASYYLRLPLVVNKIMMGIERMKIVFVFLRV